MYENNIHSDNKYRVRGRQILEDTGIVRGELCAYVYMDKRNKYKSK